MPLIVIAVFTVVSDLTSVDTGSTKLRVSGTSLGLMPSLVLYGGGPASGIGILTLLVGWPSVRKQVPKHYFRVNLAYSCLVSADHRLRVSRSR